ncbi:hypothetical protein BKA69DRAFT_384104 [Paraphysoderma sedebokerense]|nr:hypothetical protein BKA69DRAFT_384104 [Paraphysoderma sedebokerense]
MKEQIMQNEREKMKLVRQHNEKLAGNLHHLLSTKSIPGVLSTRATTDSHPHNNDCQGFGYTKSEQAGTGERQPILTHAVKDSFLPMSIDYVHTHVANDQPSSTTKTYHMCELVPAKRRELLNLNETLNRKVGSDEIIAQKRNVGSKITADSTARLAMGRLNERQLKNNNQLKSFIRESLKRTSYQPTSIARHKFMADFDSSNE